MTTNAHILRALNGNRALDAITGRYEVSHNHVKYLAVGLKRGGQDTWDDGCCPRCGFVTGKLKVENWDIIEHSDLCADCVAELRAGHIRQDNEMPAALLERWGYKSKPPKIIYGKADIADMAPQLSLILTEGT